MAVFLIQRKKLLIQLQMKLELEELIVIIEQCLNDSMIQGYGAYITDRALYVSIKEVIGYSNDGTLKDVKVSKQMR